MHTALADTIVGKTVLIIGCGPIGLAAAAIAKKVGAVKVLCQRRQRLPPGTGHKKMGADKVYKAGWDDMVADVLRKTDGLGADVLLEMSRRRQCH